MTERYVTEGEVRELLCASEDETIDEQDMSSDFYFYIFYLYTYPPDSQESDKGAIHRANNYPDLFSELL